MTINQKVKGNRVERELAQWLRERGITSARRTQQFCASAGDSDNVAEKELPHFFLECKGTQSPVLYRSLLQSWYRKLKETCPSDQLPVIFHKPNNYDWVGIMPCAVYHLLIPPQGTQYPRVLGVSGESIHTIEQLEAVKMYHKIWPQTTGILAATLGYRVVEEDILIFSDAEDMLKGMLRYEASLEKLSPSQYNEQCTPSNQTV